MAFTINISPGFTFSTDGDDKVTFAKLNQLGSPMATMSGTLGTSDIDDGAITTAKVAADAINGTKIADGAIGVEHLQTADQGTIIYRGASGWLFLAPGTSGRVLTTKGAGANPEWLTVPSVTTVSASNITPGANNTHLVTNGSGATEWAANSNVGAQCVIWDEKSAGTDAGASDHTSDTIRTLNQSSDPASVLGASLSSNQITLGAGSYSISAAVPGQDTGNHVAWLYNVTDSSITVDGARYYHGSSDTETGYSLINGAFTITETKVFEIKQRTSQTMAAHGLGRAVNITGHPEIYTTVTITKIA